MTAHLWDGSGCIFCGAVGPDEQNATCISDAEKVQDAFADQVRIHQAEELVNTLKAELKRRDDYLKDYCSIKLEDNCFVDAGPEFGDDIDKRSMDALIDWVKDGRLSAQAHGAIFDTSFRAVSEGGTVFYFDPEVWVDEVEFLRLAWQVIQRVHVPAEMLKPLLERYEKLYGKVES